MSCFETGFADMDSSFVDPDHMDFLLAASRQDQRRPPLSWRRRHLRQAHHPSHRAQQHGLASGDGDGPLVFRQSTLTATVLVVVTMSGVSRAIVGFLFSLALPRQGRVSRLYVAELASSIVSELFW